jgi:hypothetical protein
MVWLGSPAVEWRWNGQSRRLLSTVLVIGFEFIGGSLLGALASLPAF